MPFVNKAQNAACHAIKARNPNSTWDCSAWAKETPGGVKSLPKGPAPKKDDGEKAEPEKAAFYAAFLAKCAAAGLTTPEQVADAAEGLAKAAFTEALGDLFGKALGAWPTAAAFGSVVAPAAAGAVGGALVAGGANRTDKDDRELLRLTAATNAYRRQADAARLHAQVKRLVASDPRKYVPLG